MHMKFIEPVNLKLALKKERFANFTTIFHVLIMKDERVLVLS